MHAWGFSDEELDLIHTRRRQGMSMQSIAAEIGCGTHMLKTRVPGGLPPRRLKREMKPRPRPRPRTWNDTHAFCGKCEQWFPLYAFYPRTDPRYKRPVRSHCKVCEYKEAIGRQGEKTFARQMVALAKRVGTLVPEPCAICGEGNVQAHHSDYTRPLDVTWLCTKHHAEAHA